MASVCDIDPMLVVYHDSGWRVKDLIGHVAAWESEFLRSLQAHARGEAYDVPGYTDDDTYNAAAHLTYVDEPVESIFARWADTRRRLIETLLALSPDDFERPMRYPWHQNGPPRRLLGNAVGHQSEHLAHIEVAAAGAGERERLSALLADSQRRGLERARQLSPDDADAATGLSIKDRLAQQVALEEAVYESLEAYHQHNEYRIPDFEQQRFEAQAVEQRRDATLEAVLADWAAVRVRTRNLLAAMTNRHLAGEVVLPWGERATVAQVINRLIERQETRLG